MAMTDNEFKDFIQSQEKKQEKFNEFVQKTAKEEIAKSEEFPNFVTSCINDHISGKKRIRAIKTESGSTFDLSRYKELKFEGSGILTLTNRTNNSADEITYVGLDRVESIVLLTEPKARKLK